jgi:hypothetical protein
MGGALAQLTDGCGVFGQFCRSAAPRAPDQTPYIESVFFNLPGNLTQEVRAARAPIRLERVDLHDDLRHRQNEDDR